MQEVTARSSPVTKFEPPRSRSDAIPRGHLVAKLRESQAPLALVSGPAGSGKSVLLAEWFRDEPAAMWLSLDDTDNDPAVLWSSLINGFDLLVPGAAKEIRRSLSVAGGLTPDNAVAVIVNTLAKHEKPNRIFLDDVHVLDNEACTKSLGRLSRRLPDGCRLIVASRSGDPFPIHKLRLQGGVVEIDARSLAMSDVEARELLAAMGVEVDAAQVATLNRRTEGWVAGLQMAVQILRSHPDPTSSLSEIVGSDREIAGYLLGEVVAHLPSDDQTFLLRTSVLRNLNGDLCDEVSGLPDSSGRLERLERANAFVVPLDRQRRWYRYHHLFAELLIDLLSRQRPGDLADLHRRAFEWHQARGLYREAIEHALAAGLRHEAAVLLSAHWYDFANAGHIVTARRLLDRFTPDEISAFQPLTLAAAWIKGVTGASDAPALLAAAEQGDYRSAPPDGSASMTSAVALARSVFGWDGVARSLADAELAYSLEPPASPWRKAAAWLVADRHIWRDDWTAAKPFLDEVISGAPDQGAVRVLALAMLALWHVDRGELEAAIGASDAACRLIEESALGDIVTAGSVHAIRARVAQAAGDTAQAKASIAAAKGPVARVDRALPLGGIHAQILLAEAALAVGDIPTAHENLIKASATASSIQDIGAFGDHLDEIRKGIAEATGRLSARELEVAELLATDLSTRQIAETLYLSRNTVKTHLRRIYTKLEVSSRAEAVDEMRRWGLLPSPDADGTAGSVAPPDVGE